ncbi:protein FAM200C-like [Oratosquilla oratoria]|uniref:protein FAM200C-like n=1 Tax=Oratosquilla oratoria TaxID=337810 RepID=UPI003F7712F1
MGVTSIIQNSVVKPHCVICSNVLSHENMKPSILKLHFESCHSQLVDKNLAIRIDSIGHFARQNESALEASYRIAQKIAETKKPHIIGEDLIKPCILEATKVILGEQEANKMSAISFSNDSHEYDLGHVSHAMNRIPQYT